MDVSRLSQIIWHDAAYKAGVVGSNLSSAVIQNSFSITSQINHSAEVLPANNNVQDDYSRKIAVATSFRNNERDMIVVAKEKSYVIPTPRVIKTNVFVSAFQKMAGWNTLDRFTAIGRIKSGTRIPQAEKPVVEMAPVLNPSNVIQLFPNKRMTHTA